MGERGGGSLLRTKKLWVIVIVGFILGVIITISEPDLQVLAEQVSSVPNLVLIMSVALGVGVFLVAALLRILFGIALAPILYQLSETTNTPKTIASDWWHYAR